MPINILYLLSVLMNIETYIVYVQLLYGTSGYGEALGKYSCVLNQSGRCGDTFEIDARNGLPKKCVLLVRFAIWM